MKIITLFLIFFSTFLSAQITNEIYNEFFNRKYTFISYSQIKAFEIKKIKYTINESRYAFEKDSLGRDKPILEIDSNGRKIFKMIRVPTYYVEIFDTMGILEKGTITDSFFHCSALSKTLYSKTILKLFNHIENAEIRKKVPKDFSFDDTLAQSQISINSQSKTIVVTNYSEYFSLPKTFFFNDSFQLVKDSLSANLGIYTGCGTNTLVTNYSYDQKGRLITKTPEQSMGIQIQYDEQNRIKTMLNGKKPYLQFLYPTKSKLEKVEIGDLTKIEYVYSSDLKLAKVNINQEGRLSFIEIEY